MSDLLPGTIFRRLPKVAFSDVSSDSTFEFTLPMLLLLFTQDRQIGTVFDAEREGRVEVKHASVMLHSASWETADPSLEGHPERAFWGAQGAFIWAKLSLRRFLPEVCRTYG